MKRFALILTLSLSLVTGCGFHLRGKIDLPDSLSTLYVKAPQVELRDELGDALQTSGATVVKSATADSATINIETARYRREVRTVDERGKSTGYILFLDVDYSVVDNQGNTVVKKTRTSARRDYTFDDTQALVAQRQEEILRQELREDVSQAILRRLARVK
jgi:LPS-assembly lipoprotein